MIHESQTEPISRLNLIERRKSVDSGSEDNSQAGSVCFNCGSVGYMIAVCARCGVPEYCSRDCQLVDYFKVHSDECARLKEVIKPPF